MTWFLYLKFILRIGFEDIEGITRNMTQQLQKSLKDVSAKEKLTEKSVLNAKRTVLKKIKVSGIVS